MKTKEKVESDVVRDKVENQCGSRWRFRRPRSGTRVPNLAPRSFAVPLSVAPLAPYVTVGILRSAVITGPGHLLNESSDLPKFGHSTPFVRFHCKSTLQDGIRRPATLTIQAASSLSPHSCFFHTTENVSCALRSECTPTSLQSTRISHLASK